MRRRFAVPAVIGSVLSLAAVTGCPVEPVTPDPGAPTFTVSTVISGQVNPWDIAWTPDGTMLFTERPGRINAMVGGAKRVLADPVDAVNTSEGGTLGLAVDPDFATNRRIFVCFESNISGALDERVASYVVDAGFTTLTGRSDIVTGIPLNTSGQAGRHSGCRLAFGPDGYLYVTTGDAVRSDTAQNPTSLGGKILRVTATGAPALRATPAEHSTPASTRSATAIRRASRSDRATAPASRSSREPGATTRSTSSPPEPTTDGTPVRPASTTRTRR